MNKAELTDLVTAQLHHVNRLLLDGVLHDDYSDDGAEYTKAACGALELMVRVLVEGSEPYNAEHLLQSLIQLYPGDGLAEKVRAHPLYEACLDRDEQMDFWRVEQRIGETNVAPIIFPISLYLKRHEARAIVLQLQRQIDAPFPPIYPGDDGWRGAGEFKIEPISTADFKQALDDERAAEEKRALLIPGPVETDV